MDINLRKFIYILINIFLVILQVTLFSNLKIGWININFALISVILTSLFTDNKFFLINALVIGFVFDAVASISFGFYITLFLIISIVVKLFSGMINRYNFVTVLFTVFSATFLVEIITYWVKFLFNGIEYNAFVLTKIIMPQTLVNTSVTVFLYWFYLWLIKVLDIKDFRR